MGCTAAAIGRPAVAHSSECRDRIKKLMSEDLAGEDRLLEAEIRRLKRDSVEAGLEDNAERSRAIPSGVSRGEERIELRRESEQSSPSGGLRGEDKRKRDTAEADEEEKRRRVPSGVSRGDAGKEAKRKREPEGDNSDEEERRRNPSGVSSGDAIAMLARLEIDTKKDWSNLEELRELSLKLGLSATDVLEYLCLDELCDHAVLVNVQLGTVWNYALGMEVESIDGVSALRRRCKEENPA